MSEAKTPYQTPERAAQMTPPHPCPICEGPTVYQSFSGGREWYCGRCDTTGYYPNAEPCERLDQHEHAQGWSCSRIAHAMLGWCAGGTCSTHTHAQEAAGWRLLSMSSEADGVTDNQPSSDVTS